MEKTLTKYKNGLIVFFDEKDIKKYGLRNGDKLNLDDMFLIDGEENAT